MTSTIQFWMDIMLNYNLPKMDDQYNPILDGYYDKIISFQKWMTSTIQFWVDIMINNILPKMDDQYNPILDESYTS